MKMLYELTEARKTAEDASNFVILFGFGNELSVKTSSLF